MWVWTGYFEKGNEMKYIIGKLHIKVCNAVKPFYELLQRTLLSVNIAISKIPIK